MEHKVLVRIIGPVGSGKSAVYSKIAAMLTDSGATVVHADEQAWKMLQNAGEAARATQDMYSFAPQVTLEEVLAPRLTGARAPILQYFTYEHLPKSLQTISRPFAELALEMDARLPDGPEKSAGLRKLLEAKDCAVRAFIAK